MQALEAGAGEGGVGTSKLQCRESLRSEYDSSRPRHVCRVRQPFGHRTAQARRPTRTGRAEGPLGGWKMISPCCIGCYDPSFCVHELRSPLCQGDDARAIIWRRCLIPLKCSLKDVSGDAGRASPTAVFNTTRVRHCVYCICCCRCFPVIAFPSGIAALRLRRGVFLPIPHPQTCTFIHPPTLTHRDTYVPCRLGGLPKSTPKSMDGWGSGRSRRFAHWPKVSHKRQEVPCPSSRSLEKQASGRV